MLANVQNYDPTHPKLKKSYTTRKWSTLFLYDLAFGFSARRKNERGQTLRKLQGDDRLSKRFRSVHEANISKMLSDNKNFTHSEPLPIPSVDPENFTADGFEHWKNQINMPLVIKGYLKDAPILELAAKEALIENHGDKRVKCVQPKAHIDAKDESNVGQNVITAETTLKEFLVADRYDSYYINNFFGMLSNEDFLEYCKGKELDELLGQSNILTQWFISRIQASGSTLHCAGGDNMFLNVKGRKEWMFIHPSYTPILEPSMSKYGVFCVSETDETFEEDYYQFLMENYPHFKHVPVYKAVLEEGDMLFNPPYWWHRVQNLTPYTVGCATRYIEARNTYLNGPTFFTGTFIESIKSPKKSPHYLAWKSIKDKNFANKFIDTIFSKTEKDVEKD